MGFLALSFCLLFILALPPPASAEEIRRRELQYIIEGKYSIIEGGIFDSETGDPVAGASIKGEVHSETLQIDAVADASGHFVVEVMEEGDHTYALNVYAPGYEIVTITGSIKFGERKSLQISLKYDPFDLQLSESSGSLVRGYRESSYAVTRLIPFKAQRTVQIFDSRGQPVYDTVEERVLVGYTWEQLVTSYRTEYYKINIQIQVPRYRTERYISGWTTVRSGRLAVRVPVISTRQIFDGYTVKLVPKTVSHLVPYQQWVTRRSPTPDFYADPRTKTLRDDVRNPREVYKTTIRQVPRTRVETYTAYRTYSYSVTDYSFLPWESKQVQVRAIPKNGYAGRANLGVSAGPGITARLSDASLDLAAETSAVLSITPEGASSQVILLRGHDSKGRFVESCNYAISLTESLPQGSPLDYYTGTRGMSFVDAKTKTVLTTDLVSVKTTTITTSPLPEFKSGVGAAYVSHVYHGLQVKDGMVYQFGAGIPLEEWPRLIEFEPILEQNNSLGESH